MCVCVCTHWVIVFNVGNGHSEPTSNPGQECLYLT